MYSLEKMLVLEPGCALMRVTVDCPRKFVSDLAKASAELAACRLDYHLFDKDRKLIVSRSQHQFNLGKNGTERLGEDLFCFRHDQITCEISDASDTFEKFRKAEFIVFNLFVYEARPWEACSFDERISKLEHFVHRLWYAPGMPGVIEARAEFEQAVAAHVSSTA